MMSGVTIALKGFHHSGPYRIEMTITNQLQKVFVFLTNDGLVASFKQVSALMIFKVEILAVGLLQALQMIVVPDPDPHTGFVLAQLHNSRSAPNLFVRDLTKSTELGE
jgi:hypothetical protein